MSFKTSKIRKRKYKDNILKEQEIRSYLHKINKYRIPINQQQIMSALIDESCIFNSKDSSKRNRYHMDSESCHVDISTNIAGDDSIARDESSYVSQPSTSSIIDITTPTHLHQTTTNEVKISETMYTNPDYKGIYVDRDFDINIKRMVLPSCMMEHEIIDSVKSNDVLLIFGDTGTGKSTQIPQFLYEHGFCIDNKLIGITQIRRVACIAIAQQVSMELNSKSLVGYQVRYNRCYNAETCKIKFMTDGILLNELSVDLLCSKYSVIIIDEAHERKTNSDILIGILSRIVKIRRMRYNNGDTTLPPLKLIIMSATIKKEDFLESKLFENNITHLQIPANVRNCTIHYSRKTTTDYLLAARDKILKIHRLLPPGSILVFLTGKEELYRLKRLINEKHMHILTYESHETSVQNNLGGDDENFDLDEDDENLPTEDLSFDYDDYVNEENDDAPYQFELDILSKSFVKMNTSKWYGSDSSGYLKIIILHASQTDEEQMESFLMPKDNERVVILSTNVAETSVTLPNIRYVIDCGKEKRKHYDIAQGVSNFYVCNISKSSAEQRAGRTGRLGHGHCYRLYTKAVYESFEDHTPAEITSCNLENALLLLTFIGISDHHNFPFLTMPPIEHINISLKSLIILGAIKIPKVNDPGYNTLYSKITSDPFKISAYYPNICDYNVINETRNIEITKLGQSLSLIPMEPRYSKMIYASLNRGNSSDYIRLAFFVISALSFNGPIFIDSDKTSSNLPSFTNDVDLLIWICCEYSKIGTNKSDFCKSYSLSEKSLKEIFLQAIQVYNIIKINFNSMFNEDINWNEKIKTPTSDNKKLIKECIIECLTDKVAINNKYLTNSTDKHGYMCMNNINGIECVYLENRYSNFKPECVVYNMLVGKDKITMKNILQVDVTHLSKIDSPLIISKNIKNTPLPSYNKENDAVEVYVERYYAPLNYHLDNVKLQLNLEHPLTTRIFAQHFCFGLIYNPLSKYKKFLTVTMDDFIQPIKYSGNISNMLKTMYNNGINNRASFEKHYLLDNTFLFEEYKHLLKDGTELDEILSCYKCLI